MEEQLPLFPNSPRPGVQALKGTYVASASGPSRGLHVGGPHALRLGWRGRRQGPTMMEGGPARRGGVARSAFLRSGRWLDSHVFLAPGTLGGLRPGQNTVKTDQLAKARTCRRQARGSHRDLHEGQRSQGEAQQLASCCPSGPPLGMVDQLTSRRRCPAPALAALPAALIPDSSSLHEPWSPRAPREELGVSPRTKDRRTLLGRGEGRSCRCTIQEKRVKLLLWCGRQCPEGTQGLTTLEQATMTHGVSATYPSTAQESEV